MILFVIQLFFYMIAGFFVCSTIFDIKNWLEIFSKPVVVAGAMFVPEISLYFKSVDGFSEIGKFYSLITK